MNHFGTRLETFFIGLCVAIGELDGKPFSVAKIAAYMCACTVIRRLDLLQSWGMIIRTKPALARPNARLRPIRESVQLTCW